MLGWCLITLAVNGPVNDVPWQPNLDPKVELETKTREDPDTREARDEWVKDPATGQLKPKMEDGQPVVQESEALKKLGIHAQDDPLGFLARMLPENTVQNLRHPTRWLSILGVIGLLI